MRLRWEIAKRHGVSIKRAKNNNRIVTSPVVISGVDIIELSSNARV